VQSSETEIRFYKNLYFMFLINQLSLSFVFVLLQDLSSGNQKSSRGQGQDIEF